MGLQVLFSLRKLFSNFEHLPVNLSCKLFDTLIRPVLQYICEVWYMEDYLPLIEPFVGLRKIIKLVTSYPLITKRHVKKFILNNVNSFWDLKKPQVILPRTQS